MYNFLSCRWNLRGGLFTQNMLLLTFIASFLLYLIPVTSPTIDYVNYLSILARLLLRCTYLIFCVKYISSLDYVPR